ncbi:MAG TPA: hypothetical protein PLN63_03225, partial [Paludibacteraceae bacterium]|nr:hypothetical protein [Paludibacteraceae bacterium]
PKRRATRNCDCSIFVSRSFILSSIVYINAANCRHRGHLACGTKHGGFDIGNGYFMGMVCQEK